VSKRFPTYVLNLVLILFACGSKATSAGVPASLEDPRLNLSIGHAGVADGLDHPYRFGVEYSARPLTRWKLIPNIGFVWSISNSNYTYAGLQRDFTLGDNLILTPSFDLGFYEGSEELQLGHHLEFRSGLTIAYVSADGYRLGVALYHLLNGGIAEHNPGTESAVLAVSVPL
jgi:lipid A 3-O-deacylase